MALRKLTFDAKAKKTIKGKFKPSTAAERNFAKSLKKVAQYSGHIVERHVEGTSIRDKEKMQKALNEYAEALGPWAERQSAKLLEQVQKSNKRAYTNKAKSMGRLLSDQLGDTKVGGVAARLLLEQVALIKSIPLEAGERAQKLAYDAFLNGTRADEIAEQLSLSTDVAINRAKLIAVTETARANAAINQARATSAGSNQYRWHNSGDEAVRHSHKFYKGKRLQGMIFSWDDPPTLDDGMKGHPGTFPRCRCFAEPVFDDE